MSNKFPTSISDLPNDPFLAILMPKSTYVEGDQRSKDCPGHGYPAHTVNSWDIVIFENEQDWKEEINRRIRYKDSFKPVKIVPAKISTIIEVKIDDLL